MISQDHDARSKKFAALKPSQQLRQALADLEAVEHDPRYKVDMNFWHVRELDEPCEVCFGGSVLARTIEVPYDYSYDAGDFDIPFLRSLTALNCVREGHWSTALYFWSAEEGSRRSSDLEHLLPAVPSYPDVGFKPAIREAADILETNGL